MEVTSDEAPDEPVFAVIGTHRSHEFMGYRISRSGREAGATGAPRTVVLAVSRDPGVVAVYIAFVLFILVSSASPSVGRSRGAAPHVVQRRPRRLRSGSAATRTEPNGF